MSFLRGNKIKIIYESENNSFKVGIITIKETDDESLKENIGKTIHFIGNFSNLNSELDYIFYGTYFYDQKYGDEYKVNSYEVTKPSSLEEISSYLGSGIFEGIGIKTAEKIVKKFKENTFDIIQNNPKELLCIKGMSLKKIESLCNKYNNLTIEDKLIKDLNKLGFSINESIKIIKKYKGNLKYIIENDLYILVDIVDFVKVDNIYIKYNDINSDLRIESVIKYIIKKLSYETGNTLINKESVYIETVKYFNNDFPLKTFNLYIEKLIKEFKIYEFDNYLMLDYFYECDKKISQTLYSFNKIKDECKNKDIDSHIKFFEEVNNIKLNKDQREAIKGSIKNNVFIITGGPGTGKTTIIKAITSFYKNKKDIALLAPTGRSAKRMSESVALPCYTIHKFLKWDKENGTFGVNVNNKSDAKIIIIDEFSMVDMFLFSSLIDGIKTDVKLILVGDANQLPSIKPGNLLYDFLNNESINKKYLNYIYRRDENSYINILADDIKLRKNIEIIDSMDFKFIESEDENINEYVKQICERMFKKDVNQDDFQILVPMYKGINGIDNINKIVQSIFNSKEEYKNEIAFSNRIFREGDKVMNLVNDVENNVYNGDIGYISNIILEPKKEIEVIYNNNIVSYKGENIDDITLAYAISIHKSQGSEYDNVIIILASSHKRMLYNKLIYTACTRSKKGLVVIGKIDNFNLAIKSEEKLERKTYLQNLL